MDPFRILKNEACKKEYVDIKNDRITCPLCNYSMKIININSHIKKSEVHQILLIKHYKNNVE